jgi:hypothetical protein
MSDGNVITFPTAVESEKQSTPNGWNAPITLPRDGSLVWILCDGKRFIGYWHQEWSWKEFRVRKHFAITHCIDGEAVKGRSVVGWLPLPVLSET